MIKIRMCAIERRHSHEASLGVHENEPLLVCASTISRLTQFFCFNLQHSKHVHDASIVGNSYRKLFSYLLIRSAFAGFHGYKSFFIAVCSVLISISSDWLPLWNAISIVSILFDSVTNARGREIERKNLWGGDATLLLVFLVHSLRASVVLLP